MLTDHILRLSLQPIAGHFHRSIRYCRSSTGTILSAYRAAGPEAVAGFREVLEAMMDEDMRLQYVAMRDKTE